MIHIICTSELFRKICTSVPSDGGRVEERFVIVVRRVVVVGAGRPPRTVHPPLLRLKAEHRLHDSSDQQLALDALE